MPNSLHRAALTAGFALPLLAACSGRGNADAALESLAACRLDGIARELRCGHIAVAENPDQPDGRKIDVHFAVVPATAMRKLDDPVFVIAGGPGQSAISLADKVMPLFEDLNARRDIVFIDQRGTGRSNALECRAKGSDELLAQALDNERQNARLAACRDKLIGRGDDLAQYATWIAVRDFDRVRERLGYAQVNLWGASYGTRAALEYARQFPTHVRVMVLDGVAPASMILPASFALDTDAALAAWSAACAKSAACKAQVPDLGASVDNLFAQATSGIDADVADPAYGTPAHLRLNRDNLLNLVRAPLYAPSAAAVLPYALARAGAADYRPLLALGALLGGSLETGFAEAMHFSVVCAEDLPRVDAKVRTSVANTRAGTAFVDQYAKVCKDWPVRPVPAEFYATLRLAAPVLLLSGGIDPATPPRHAQTVASALGNTLHLVAPNLGHGISGQACGPDLVRKFIRAANFDGLEPNCLGALPMPTLFTPPAPPAAKTP